MNRWLILFAKEPKKNQVKTRLRPYLPTGSAEGIYMAFLRDVVEIARQVQCENKLIAYESVNENPEFIQKIAPDFKIIKQTGKDLGERMYQIFWWILHHKVHHVIIIGTDIPTLPTENLQMAFKQLSYYDVVLGPSLDGGYYLIGLKKPHQEIFINIDWGSNQVLNQTVCKINKMHLKAAFIPRWYDVDDQDGLNRLIKDLKGKQDKSIARWTRKYLGI